MAIRDSTDRVRRHTAETVDVELDQQLAGRVRRDADRGPEEIGRRREVQVVHRNVASRVGSGRTDR